jgi:phenylpropionate dioxygenase-like ring-hydroxylating dioxygenase large terminal subunit
MGNLMREYWIPGLLSTELATPDCAPLRLRLLGEDLIAFRATSGAVGVIQNACPHRGASMFFGRNEEEGLRCVYHGWKFDVTGACVDMPSEPNESNFKNKVRTKAYPSIERNGVIWTYMGSREVPPPLPNLEPNMVDGEIRFGKVLRECNWMQALEGDIDTSHFNFLHARVRQTPSPGTFEYYMERDKSPKYAVTDTEIGTSYGAYRPAEPGTNYWRIAHFLFPFYTMIPTGVMGAEIRVRAWIPADDNNTLWFEMVAPRATTSVTGSGTRVVPEDSRRRVPPRPLEYAEDTTDWLGRWRLAANGRNDYNLDRAAQLDGSSYTGIDTGGALLQDQAVTESMGTVYDRSSEHLGTSDSMVIRTRRRLISAAVAHRDDGEIPPGVDNPTLYETRSGGAVIPVNADWLEATADIRRAFVKHPDEKLLTPTR